MEPIRNGKYITEIVFDNNTYEIKAVKKYENLEDKYYFVKKDNNYGIYHKYYGFSSNFIM